MTPSGAITTITGVRHHVPAALRGIIAGACLGALAVAGAAAAPTSDPASRGIGAILPAGNLATATAGPRNPVRSARATPSGAVAAGGTVSVNVGAAPRGSGGLAEGEADARGVRLFGGRVIVNSLHIGVRSDISDQGTLAGVAAWSADITVDGQAIDEQPGRPVDIAGIGTLTVVEQLVDGSMVTANALRIEVTDPASGLAPGTQVVLGHLEASAGDPIPDSPSPDPGSAPSDPGAAMPADGADSPVPTTTTPPRRSLPVAPTPVVPSTVVPSTAAPGSGLGLPRQIPPTVAATPTSEGYVFPVVGGTSNDFSADYGNPRADTGWHHGTDVFAASGTPLVAVADGTLSKVGVNRLGGNRLWLTDDRGTAYYYAHLSAFAPGVTDGLRVRAGQVIGFVGNSGDAITTPPHLHFEIHPGDGDSVDPYPYLMAWLRNAPVARAFTAATVAVGHTPAAGTLLLSADPIDEGLLGRADGTAVAVR